MRYNKNLLLPLIIKKIEDNEPLNDAEKKSLIKNSIMDISGETKYNYKAITSIVEVGDNLYSIDWAKSLNSSSENYYSSLSKVVQRMSTIDNFNHFEYFKVSDDFLYKTYNNNKEFLNTSIAKISSLFLNMFEKDDYTYNIEMGFTLEEIDEKIKKLQFIHNDKNNLFNNNIIDYYANISKEKEKELETELEIEFNLLKNNDKKINNIEDIEY